MVDPVKPEELVQIGRCGGKQIGSGKYVSGWADVNNKRDRGSARFCAGVSLPLSASLSGGVLGLRVLAGCVLTGGG